MRLKSVKPLLPPKPVSLRKNSSMKAKVSAWVMMEKYTPLMRERNAKKPKTKASIPGTSTTSSAAVPEMLRERPVPGIGLPVEEHHEVGQVALVLALAADHAHEVHAEGVAAEREEHAVPEAQDPGVAPDQIHRQRHHAVAHDLADQRDEVGRQVERAALRNGHEQHRHQHRDGQRKSEQRGPAARTEQRALGCPPASRGSARVGVGAFMLPPLFPSARTGPAGASG